VCRRRIHKILAGKTLEQIEAPALFEGFRIQLDRRVRREHAGATAGIFLGCAFVGSAVGTEEESRIPA
jgi:hypothetical protein